ncbi:MAG: SRPBCC family protein [Actinomycetales bacterium]
MSAAGPEPRRVVYELEERQVLAAERRRVYHALVDPAEQVAWNSLYLEASATPPGPIATGSRLTGRFKGSGRAEVTFMDVVQDQRFTHHSVLSIPRTPVHLGLFDHTYSVREARGGTELTQHVRFEPSGLGRWLAPVIVQSFRRRLPVSFDELRRYLESH